MKSTGNNPFCYGRVVQGENFCARPTLERELQRLVREARSVVVQGERRMGKTSLVCEAIRKQKAIRMIYIDLFGIRTVEDFCHKTTRAVLARNQSRSFVAHVAELLRRLRSTLSIDVQSGVPTLSVDVASVPDATTIETVMDMLAAQAGDRPLCVVFDEFQDILRLERADALLGTMRGKIQFQQNVAYVFLGSVRNQMAELFASPRSAFYKSAALMDVGRIDDADFLAFLRSRFKAGDRRVDDATLLEILDSADRVSGDVQELCDALWVVTADEAPVTSGDIPRALELVFSRESKAYPPLITQLTALQMRVLTTVAELGGRQVLSGAFMRHCRVVNSSSVRKALQRLVALDILYAYEGEYRFCNPFFKAWLLRKYAV